MSDNKNPPPIFLDIGPDTKPIQMESLCMSCMKNGTTTLLLTRIPFFREVMISRFECPHCGFQNNSVQFAGEYPAKGVHCELHVTSPEDLNRRIVKSSHCVIKVPAIEFEIPGPTQGDSISTIEGVLEQAYEGLKMAEQTPKLVEFLENLHQCVKGLVQFDLILDDPSGNSFIENPSAPNKDPQLDVSFYNRTPEQNEAIGLMKKPQADNFQVDDKDREQIDSVFAEENNEVMTFPTTCPVCSYEGTMKSCTLVIPHFKEIIIMAFNCPQCSYHNVEVMVGGGSSPMGRKITLLCDSNNDLNREVLKSETASVEFPELQLKLVPGTLGGKFTTIEGLVRDIHKNLKDNNPFMEGDSAYQNTQKFEQVLSTLSKYYNNEQPFTIIIDDPLSNSYIQERGENDKVEIVDYQRTYQQNEELGFNDMKTEEYTTGNITTYGAPKTTVHQNSNTPNDE